MGLIVVPVIIEPRFHVELVCELMLIDEIKIGPFIEGMLSIVIEHRSKGCGRHVLLAPLVASREGEISIGELAGVVVQVVSIRVLGDAVIRGRKGGVGQLAVAFAVGEGA